MGERDVDFADQREAYTPWKYASPLMQNNLRGTAALR